MASRVLLRGLPPPPKGFESASAHEAASLFLEALRASGRSGKTLKVYKAALDSFVSRIGPLRPAGSITLDDYVAWLSWLSGEVEAGRVSRSTAHYYSVMVRRFLAWLGVDVSRAPAFPRGPRGFSYALSWSEVERLLEAARDVYDALIVALMAESGLRVGELLSLTWGDVDLGTGQARVRGKYGKERIVFLGPVSRVILESLASRTNPAPGDRIVPLSYKAVYKRLKSLARRAGVEPGRVRPHVLRHTFATEALRRGLSLPALQRLLGHSSVKITELYLHLTGEDIRREYERAWLMQPQVHPQMPTVSAQVPQQVYGPATASPTWQQPAAPPPPQQGVHTPTWGQQQPSGATTAQPGAGGYQVWWQGQQWERQRWMRR